MLAVGCALALGSCGPQRPAGRRGTAVDRHRRLRRRLPGLRRRRGRDALVQRARRHGRDDVGPRSTTCSWSPTGTPTWRSRLADTAIDAVKGQDAFEAAAAAARARDPVLEFHPRGRARGAPGSTRSRTCGARRSRSARPNSGTEVIGRRLMEVAGVDPDSDVTPRAMGVGESAAALREGSIDAFVWSGGLPTGAITDLATTDEIVLLPLDPLRRRAQQALRRGLPGGRGRGRGSTRACPPPKTIAVPNLLMVRADMPPSRSPTT